MKTLLNRIIVIVSATLVSAGAATAPAASRATVPAEPTSSTGRAVNVSTTDARRTRAVGTSRRVGLHQQRTARVMVVPAKHTTSETIATLAEDMSIMARIVDKKLQRTRGASVGAVVSEAGFFADFFEHGHEQATEALYLGGYGLLFFTSVDFPLVAPAPSEQEQKQEEDIDPVWREAQVSMFEPGSRRDARAERAQYSVEKVTSLKAALVEALKHATNIRALDAEDSVAVVVQEARNDVHEGQTHGYAVLPVTGDPPPLDSERPSDCDAVGTLVVRARKADVDDFAAGTLTAAQFREKAEIVLSCSYVQASHQRGAFLPLTQYSTPGRAR